MSDLLYTGDDWSTDDLERIIISAEKIGREEYGLTLYPNQIEIINAEQMLDAYSSTGLPLTYKHWSYGKRFARDEAQYRHGVKSLAYEIVINSSPCIAYLMEENTTTMQALVIAHACVGHNAVFANNTYFRQFTDASSFLDYMSFAKDYVARCEEKHGVKAVERVLDAAHALSNQSVDSYTRRSKKRPEIEARDKARVRHAERSYNPLWSTIPTDPEVVSLAEEEVTRLREAMALPEENLLYFVEKYSPRLADWEKELIRIVRKIAQYFYPQQMCKVVHEGMATFCHYEMMHLWHDRGQISGGNLMEALHMHSNVIYQAAKETFNPYALGFAILQDIKRICLEPTKEDLEWFPAVAGTQDYWPVVREAAFNYRDESFISQFLSPKVIRDFRMFEIFDNEDNKRHYEVGEIHDDYGYRAIRRSLAKDYNTSYNSPEIAITDVDILNDRELVITHTMRDNRRVEEENGTASMYALSELWGYPVRWVEKPSKEGEEVESVTFDARELKKRAP
jgi:stage V sporulation protein R